jgi:dimethylaniline monooxygenase (N-oxide forming)
MGELNSAAKHTPKTRFGTKNESFCAAVVKHGAVYKQSEIESFSEGHVHFADGSKFECDAVIYCGGYGVRFGVGFDDMDNGFDMCKVKPRDLYKRVVHPDLGLRFGFVGFFRPGFGAVPPCSEMQARYLARLLVGKASLPSSEEMHAAIEHDRVRDTTQYARDSQRIGALGDFATWMDDWARLIGCRPRLTELFFTEPRLWWRVLCGQQNALQFRIHGPGRTADCRKAIMAMPMMPMPVLLIEVWVAACCKLLSLSGLRSFDLVGM